MNIISLETSYPFILENFYQIPAWKAMYLHFGFGPYRGLASFQGCEEQKFMIIFPQMLWKPPSNFLQVLALETKVFYSGFGFRNQGFLVKFPSGFGFRNLSLGTSNFLQVLL